MIIQAELKCTQTGCEAAPCAVDKVIELPSQRFQQFSRALLADAGYGGRPLLSFAGRALEDIWQQDGALLTYAAVLEAEKPETLHRACELLQDLDNYQRITEDAYGYGQQRLQETLGLDDEAIYELDGYMDFEKYGQDCMENDCVTKTEFGLLRRLDPPFPEQRHGQRMM